MDQSPSLEAPQLMETEGSLPHTQQPTTCPYPEPNQSSQYFLILLLEDPFNLLATDFFFFQILAHPVFKM